MRTADDELTVRRSRILGAIVEEHVRTCAPVGSRAVLEAQGLGVSTATIRNEMCVLEQGGYIRQPHTSAGRIPSDRGYRAYVDLIMTPHAPRGEVIAWLRGEYRRSARDPESLYRTTSRVLSRLTSAPALVMAPPDEPRVLTELRLASVSAAIVLLSYATRPGGSHQCLLQSDEPVTAAEVAALAAALSAQYAGRTLAALDLCTAASLRDQPDGAALPVSLLSQIKQAVVGEEEQRVYVDGAALSLNYPEYRELSHLRAVMEALDEERVVRRLLRPAGRQDAIIVTIGEEQEITGLQQCALVAQAFRATASPDLGVLGVLGPTRMDYQVIAGAVAEVAREVSHSFAETREEDAT